MKLRRVAVIVVGFAGLSSLGIRWFEKPPTPRPGRAELFAALKGASSPFPGTFVDFPLPALREGQALAPAGDEITLIAQQIEEAAEQEGSPRDLADYALVKLLEEDPDKAVALLERAADLAPKDPGILSDLSAAYLTQARRSADAPIPRIRALSAANQALRLAPHLREAMCNRALAREEFYLLSPSWSAWKECLRAAREEPSLQDYAMEHLHRIRPWMAYSKPDLRAVALSGSTTSLMDIVSRSPRNAREVAEEELLAWADSYLSGHQDDARRSLILVHRIGEALWKASGDSLIRDTVAAISRPDRRASVHQTALGLQAFSQKLMARAARDLRGAGSPYALKAAYRLADSREDPTLAIRQLAQVAEQARQKGYHFLLADSLWVTGLREMDLRNPYAARRAYEGCLAAYESAHDLEGVAGAKNLLCELFDELGDPERAWQNRRAVLQQLISGGSPLRRYQAYVAAATAAYSQGFTEVALEFQAEAVRAADRVGPSAVSQALSWQSRYYRQLALLQKASQDLGRAWHSAAAVREAKDRSRVESDLLMVEAESRIAVHPLLAIEQLTGALRKFEIDQHSAYQEHALWLRARAERRLGRTAAAESDLQTAIRLIERERLSIDEEEHKASFLSGASEIYDEMISLQSEDLDNPQAALDFLEQKRARTLLDRLRASSPETKKGAARVPNPVLPSAAWAGRLPRNVIFLSYAQAGGKWLAWLVDSGGVRDFRVLGPAGSIDQAVRTIQAAAGEQRFPAAAGEAAADLYDALIRPFAERIPPYAYLMICRDERFDGVPFAMLQDREASRYLIENHPVIMVPSGNHYVASLRHDRVLARSKTGRSLFAGAPALDKDLYPDLDPLPWAAQEAERLRSLYGPGSERLTGAGATEAAFVAGLQNHDLVQFSGHALGAPRHAGLVLAPAAGEDGVLHAYEISRLRLNRPRLIVLAACGSAERTDTAAEGTRSLTEAFLTAGAPVVLGTLWSIRDQTTLDLLLEVHQGLRQGMDPARALQSAQIRFLESRESTRRSPLSWAAFELTGGVAPNL